MTATVVLPRPAAEAMSDMLRAKGLRFDVLEAALADEVPWYRLDALLADLRRHLDTPDVLGQADQTAANYIEYFARNDVDLRDERPLYQLLLTLGFISDIALIARDRRLMSQGETRALASILRSIGAVAAVLAPTDAP